jgi:hypothetical protein
MKLALDYDKLIFLDAEALAEGGIREAYTSILPNLKQYVAEPSEVREVADPSAPTYLVNCGGLDYPIYSPELPNDEGQSWGRAAHALFKIINDQLAVSEYRLFAINSGNDLGGIFLTQSEIESARRSLPRPEDWPYLPTPEHPWYGQPHS